MNDDELNPMTTRTEEAVSARLARLQSLPVDTSALSRKLRAALPAPQPRRTARWWRPLAAVAASLLLIATVSLFFFQSTEVRAEPNQMIQMHEDLVAGRIPVAKAATIDEARQVISAQWSGGEAPRLPAPPANSDHLMACCMKPLQNKKVACVLLDYQGTPVTMSVGKAQDIALPHDKPVMRDNVAFHCQQVRGYTMVMTERHGLWVCMVAKLPQEDLMNLQEKLQF